MGNGRVCVVSLCVRRVHHAHLLAHAQRSQTNTCLSSLTTRSTPQTHNFVGRWLELLLCARPTFRSTILVNHPHKHMRTLARLLPCCQPFQSLSTHFKCAVVRFERARARDLKPNGNLTFCLSHSHINDITNVQLNNHRESHRLTADSNISLDFHQSLPLNCVLLVR